MFFAWKFQIQEFRSTIAVIPATSSSRTQELTFLRPTFSYLTRFHCFPFRAAPIIIYVEVAKSFEARALQ